MHLLFLVILVILWGTVLPISAQISSHTAEFQILNLLNQYRQRMRLLPLRLDRIASEVARQHSRDMAEKNFFSLHSPQRGSLEYQLAYHRVSGRQLHALIVQDYSISELVAQLYQSAPLLDPQATHAGVGLHMKDPAHPEKGLWLTLITLEYLAEIQPIPRTVPSGQTLRIRGHVLPPFSHPRMPVTLPNGQVQTYFNVMGNRNTFIFEIPLTAGKGRYTLELLVDDPEAGPRVAAILPVYASQTYPVAEPSASPVQEQFSTTLEAAQKSLWLLNQERRRHHLPELQEDDLLTYVAWKHSEDMGKNRYFAHINLRGEDPQVRFQRAGGQGVVGENIALDTSIEGAHRRLLNSPGHRANMLDPNYTHVGIGIYFNGQYFYITQLFLRKTPLQNSHNKDAVLSRGVPIRK